MGYMREYWVQEHASPIVYRYIDWSITVPLQMIEFNLILKAAGKNTSAAGFWKLMLGTVAMLAFGYSGEEGVLPAWPAFAAGPAGYLFGYLLGAVDDVYLNVIYNVADFVNKIAFVCACWSCAKADSAAKAHLLA